ncbi:MAG TPA: hypothetical protein VFV08_09460, partial [Puia sp.]|nr:hypothetical protein [Puia sp.]
MTVQIENVVAGFFIGADIDDGKRKRSKLFQYFSEQRYIWIAHYGFNTEYNRKKFHSIVMKLRMPGENSSDVSSERRKVATISALIFRNSKVILCGSLSIEQARKAAIRVCRRIQCALDIGATRSNKYPAEMTRLYGTCRIRKFRVHNIVGVLNQQQKKIAITELFQDITNLKMHTNHIAKASLDQTI